MALTFTNADPDNRSDVAGSRRRVSGKVTFDSSYATGGETVAASLFGLQRLDHVQVGQLKGASTVTRVAVWDNANAKMMAFVIATGAEVGAAVDLSAETCQVTAWGV